MRSVLQDLADEVRSNTIRLFESAPESCLTKPPPGLSNHIIWHVGHVIWLQEVLCLRLLTKQVRMPATWAERFGMDCRPPSQTTQWPQRGAMLTALKTQHMQIQEAIAKVSNDSLNQVADPQRGPATVRQRIVHGFYDEARHGGEMYLAIKLFRAQAQSA